jgi:hypothetical protein
MGWPVPSALPPSIGTTGVALASGAGLVCGITADGPAALDGLAPVVASTAPMAAPATASTLTRTGTRRLGFADDP